MEDPTVVWAMFQAGIKFFESPDRLPDRNDDVTLDKVNFRSDIKVFLKKKSGLQEFVWLLKQFGAAAF